MFFTNLGISKKISIVENFITLKKKLKSNKHRNRLQGSGNNKNHQKLSEGPAQLYYLLFRMAPI